MDDATFLERLERIVGPEGLRAGRLGRALYRRDASFLNAEPLAVCAPATVAQAQQVVRLCREASVPFTPRGAGTGLAGGAVPVAPERAPLVVALGRLDRIIHIDPEHRRAWVQPGVPNARLSERAAPYGLRFAPDPASQIAATLGGNVATNAGGIHCLSEGVTSAHVLAVELLGADGELHLLGGDLPEQGGLDLRGLAVGSEGTFGLVTKACVRLQPLPPQTRTLLAGFPSAVAAARAVSRIVTGDTLPAALELMDREAVELVEPYARAGYPMDAEAVLLAEFEGLPAEVAHGAEAASEACTAEGATSVEIARTAEHRTKLWKGRKGVAGAIAKRAPDFYLHDVVVPRSGLADMLAGVLEIAADEELLVINVVHAGDGNLHPFLLFDREDPGVLDRVLRAGHRIVETALAAGGVLTGEHGVGIEKRDLLGDVYSEDDLAVQRAVRDAMDPSGLANPGKVLPSPQGCAEGTQRLVPEGTWV
ncbi:FAD-binding oxidoreductase [Egibacter rhizosphaerae]|uniref:FAD-binding oxidoreductase n=1 Tax=Egibacter rhizosphaerae TaxID=1670831 RepID=UPI0013F1630B|nr:FAD-linked oxidase C-terminal domain-containing protein [Egibacter rhizosphaerae]